jgi:hypothetical protein
MTGPQKKSLSEAQVNALLGALEAQRNNALNAQAETAANLTMAQAKITELDQQVKQLQADLANAPVAA